MKHTPGPWTRLATEYGPVRVAILVGAIAPNAVTGMDRLSDEYAVAIVACPVGEADEEENAANAQLIAAAPELLEALEAALPFIRGRSSALAVLEQVEAAIAKARGEK